MIFIRYSIILSSWSIPWSLLIWSNLNRSPSDNHCLAVALGWPLPFSVLHALFHGFGFGFSFWWEHREQISRLHQEEGLLVIGHSSPFATQNRAKIWSLASQTHFQLTVLCDPIFSPPATGNCTTNSWISACFISLGHVASWLSLLPTWISALLGLHKAASLLLHLLFSFQNRVADVFSPLYLVLN